MGPKSGQFLREQGIKTIGDLAGQSAEWFRAAFGSRGPELRERALGRDDSPVVPEHEVKSVSSETTFAQDLSSPEELLPELRTLVQQVAERLRRHELRGRTVTVKMRLSDFTTFTLPDNAGNANGRRGDHLRDGEAVDGPGAGTGALLPVDWRGGVGVLRARGQPTDSTASHVR